MPVYSIGEFSKIVQISVHTLRYYEKENLLLPRRLPNGHRCYSVQDISWIQFIQRLKGTGMPLKEIRKYAAYRAAGDATVAARMEMLVRHRAAVREEIEKWNNHLKKLDEKIAFYQDEIKRLAGP